MTRPEQYSAYDASNPATPPEELAHIAEHRTDLRALVAGNPATPPDVLDRLGRLGDLAVDAALRRRGPAGFAAPSAVVPPAPGPGWAGTSDSYAVSGAASDPYAVPGAASDPYATAGAGYGTSAPWASGAAGGPGGSGAVRWIIAGAVAVAAVVVGLLFSGGSADPVADATASASEEADPDAVAYGDDPHLDELWDACESGDAQACDDLFMDSPIDSEYEAFGASCGGRFEGTGEWCTDVM